MRFEPADGEYLDWFGRDHRERLRWFEGELWYPKVMGRPELLAFELAAGLLNIAEVRRAPDAWSVGPDAVMIKIAQQYSVSDLPISSLDEAVASELVFSLWIRRRDTHAFNRVYVDGVPVFFDHHVAFSLAEPENATVDGLMRDGGDGGHVLRWRVRSHGPDLPLATVPMRVYNRSHDHAVHAIDRSEVFLAALEQWTHRICARDLSGLEDVIARAGYQEGDIPLIAGLLRDSQRQLPAMVERVGALVFEPMSAEGHNPTTALSPTRSTRSS